MMKILGIGSLLTLCAVSATLQAQARDYPKRPYNATYTTTSPTGTTTMRLACDGKGHILSEAQAGHYNMISILDFPANVAFIVRPDQKRVTKMPMTDEQASIYDENSSKKPTGKPLGAKVVDGHPCTGWLYVAGTSGQVETWLADDIHLAVKTITTTKMGTTTTALKSYSNAAPPASDFAIPAGFAVTEMKAFPPPP